MRSLKYYAVALPLHFLAADARQHYDTTVVVTQTRTVTVCPVIDMFRCVEPEPTRPWKDWTTSATSATTTSTGSSSLTTTTSSREKDDYTTKTSSSTSWETTRSTSSGETTSSTRSTSSGETTKTTSSTVTTSSGQTTSSTSSNTGSTSSSTTTKSSTSTSWGPYSCPTSGDYTCPSLWKRNGNTPDNRSKWYQKSIENDSHEKYESGQTVKYSLVLTRGTTDADGAGSRPVMFVNGKTPGETIEANWGDWIEVDVTNSLGDTVTSIHWHGIRQEGTNDQDGVPGVTECGIAPGATRKYRFLASSYGTGWYHSHALTHYGSGIRGAMIIHGPATANYDIDMGAVMIDEKLRESAETLAFNVSHTQGPLPPASNVLFNGKNTSPDNTKGQATKYVVRSGKKHLFRIINSSVQSAYAVRFDSHNMTVISADYVPLVPYTTDVLWIGSGQRYNVIVEANQNSSSYYLRAISQTGCGSVSVNDGRSNANAIFEYDDALGTAPLVGTGVSNTTIVTSVCKDEPISSLVPYKSKSAGSYADFQAKVKLIGSGNPGLLVDPLNISKPAIRWFMGPPDELSANIPNYNATKGINVTFEQPTLRLLSTVPDAAVNLSSSSYVLSGGSSDWVYFVLQSSFHTSHPMHLHGHDFSLLGQGTGVFSLATHGGVLNFNNPPRRDSANLYGARGPTPTQGWTVIGFQADNPGAWLMHCHILWHADGGMGLQYIERQGDIKDYYNKSPEFDQQCDAVEAYYANGGKHKDFYEAGVKRHLAEHHAKRHGHAI